MAYKQTSPIPLDEGGSNNGGTSPIELYVLHAPMIFTAGQFRTLPTAGNAGEVLASNGGAADPSYQSIASLNIVSGPGSSTDRAIATWNGTTGTLLRNNSTITVAASGNLVMTAGNISIPATSASTAGVVTQSGNRLIHTYGTQNLFMGANAGNFTLNATTSLANTAYGISALTALTAGATNNAAFGFASLLAVTTGQGNSGIGTNTGFAITTGTYNDILGNDAGIRSTGVGGLTTGSYNTIIGAGNGAAVLAAGSAYTGAESSNLLIKNAGVVGESNVIRIGTSGSGNAQQSTCYIAGIAGVSVSNINMVTIDSSTGQLGSQSILGARWSVITANQTAVVNSGYFCNKAGTLALALPATSAVGDIIEVSNVNTATGTQFTQAAGQQIFIGNTSTTLGATGTLTSSQIGDALKMVCRTANTTWFVVSMIGNWTPA